MELYTCSTEYNYQSSQTLEIDTIQKDCELSQDGLDMLVFFIVLVYILAVVKLVDFIKNLIIHFSS